MDAEDMRKHIETVLYIDYKSLIQTYIPTPTSS